MLKKTLLTVLFIALMLTAGLCKLRSQEITIQRNRSYLREGPGSYYKVIAEIPVKTKLKAKGMDDSWYKVTYKAKEGYVSVSATKAQAGTKDVFAKMGGGSADITVSRHGMSAGVKGFGERFTKAFKGNPDFLVAAEEYSLNTKEYKKFRDETYKGINVKNIRKTVPLYKRNKPDYFTEAQEGFGLGLASAIAALGIYNNPVMQEYVNSVGQIVVEGCDVTDVTFKFFIIDIPAPNAYACPGGYIFVTRGMLSIITNEAELACILAHEIAHVSRFHGMKEIAQRKNQIAADDVFSELDEELPDAYNEEEKLTEQELEDEAFSMFETLIQGRLDQYEQEADALGMRFAVRAGYDPKAMRSVLSRMVSSGAKSNNEHFRPEIMQKRMQWVDTELAKRKYPSGLQTIKSRWQKYTVK